MLMFDMKELYPWRFESLRVGDLGNGCTFLEARYKNDDLHVQRYFSVDKMLQKGENRKTDRT